MKEINEYEIKEDNENRDIAIVIQDFNGDETNQLSMKKNEYIIIEDWNIKEGWIYGYKRDDPHKRGIFPSSLVKKGLFQII